MCSIFYFVKVNFILSGTHIYDLSSRNKLYIHIVVVVVVVVRTHRASFRHPHVRTQICARLQAVYVISFR